MSEKSSLAKRLIKDLVIQPSKANLYDENSTDLVKSEPVTDGYVIVSFSNRKKAKISTATFSDVSKSSPDALNLLRHQQNHHLFHASDTNPVSHLGEEDDNIPNEDNFYGEAFWIGSDDEDEPNNTSATTHPDSNCEANDKTARDSCGDSYRDESDSLTSVKTPKISRLTAISRGLTPRDSNNNIKSVLLNHNSSSSCGNTDDGRKMLRCRECGKHYRNEYSLRHHICLRRKEVWKKGDVPKQLVDGQLIYFCPSCNKPFRWMGNLTRHFYVHTGQRFFRCGLCDKEFFSAYQVRRHMNSHTGQRYKCRICDKPFTCVYACTWHMRQHNSAVAGTSTVNTNLSGTTVATPLSTTGSSASPPIPATLLPASLELQQQQHHQFTNISSQIHSNSAQSNCSNAEALSSTNQN